MSDTYTVANVYGISGESNHRTPEAALRQAAKREGDGWVVIDDRGNQWDWHDGTPVITHRAEHNQRGIIMHIAVYAQHTTSAGQQCWDDELIDRKSDDIVIYTGTPDELLAQADTMARFAAANSNGAYSRQVADTLRAAVVAACGRE